MKNRLLSIIAVALWSVVSLPASMPQAAVAQRAATDGQSLAVAVPAATFQTVLAGVTADGEGSVWEGHTDGVVSGRVRLELSQSGPAIEAANPVWHVRARWTLNADDSRSFVADLTGVVDWKAGLIRLAGHISSGWMTGGWLEQHGRVADGDIAGTIIIVR